MAGSQPAEVWGTLQTLGVSSRDQDQEKKTPSISGNNALKALEKQWELEHFWRQGQIFVFFSVITHLFIPWLHL